MQLRADNERLSLLRGDDSPASLTELLTETRIILPGTEVFLAFLMTLPFTARFEALDRAQRLVYLSTFFATVLALACFVAPAAYHRIARPIRDKERFKMFANVLLVAGLAPMSLAFVLVSYLVTSVVVPSAAVAAAAFVGATVVTLWWAVPLARAHDRFPKKHTPDCDSGDDSEGRPSWRSATAAGTNTTRR